MSNELTYWVALTHTPKMWTSRKNEIVAYCFRQNKTLVDFFESDNFLQMELSQQERDLLMQTKTEMANYAFLVEEITNQGYGIIPIISSEYSPLLKANLKYSAPIVLYTKGNKQILQEPSIAIVGSRNANEKSLQFADNVAKKASAECKVIVSGFAKGVDQQALVSALTYKGHSIIVLPQGITTFSGGMKKYYKQIVEGDVLILSTFHPKMPWSVELAMARNPIIYGLASDIYAAQSDDKGGTWSGVTDGLKKGRKVYVRVPEENEKCANMALISKGACPVDIEGNPIQIPIVQKGEIDQPQHNIITPSSTIEDEIIKLLTKGSFSSKQIIDILKLTGYSPQKITNILSKMDNVYKVKDGRSFKYSLQSSFHNSQLSLSL